MISCRQSAAPDPPKSKKAVKKGASHSTTAATVWEVVLHDTILFPEGGGQPSDIGFLTLTTSGTRYDVPRIERHGSIAVHYLILDASAPPPVHAGDNVLLELGEQGYARRYDHMCMHTSQHLLSAILESTKWNLNFVTVGWSLTGAGPCYVDLDRAITPEEVTFAQNEANRLVFEGRRIFVEVDLVGTNNPASSVPSDYTGGVNRVVIIDGVDRNP